MSCRSGVALYNGCEFGTDIVVDGVATVDVFTLGTSTGVGRSEGVLEDGGSEVRGDVKESVFAGDEGESCGEMPEYMYG